MRTLNPFAAMRDIVDPNQQSIAWSNRYLPLGNENMEMDEKQEYLKMPAKYRKVEINKTEPLKDAYEELYSRTLELIEIARLIAPHLLESFSLDGLDSVEEVRTLGFHKVRPQFNDLYKRYAKLYSSLSEEYKKMANPGAAGVVSAGSVVETDETEWGNNPSQDSLLFVEHPKLNEHEQRIMNAEDSIPMGTTVVAQMPETSTIQVSSSEFSDFSTNQQAIITAFLSLSGDSGVNLTLKLTDSTSGSKFDGAIIDDGESETGIIINSESADKKLKVEIRRTTKTSS